LFGTSPLLLATGEGGKAEKTSRKMTMSIKKQYGEGRDLSRKKKVPKIAMTDQKRGQVTGKSASTILTEEGSRSITWRWGVA